MNERQRAKLYAKHVTDLQRLRKQVAGSPEEHHVRRAVAELQAACDTLLPARGDDAPPTVSRDPAD